MQLLLCYSEWYIFVAENLKIKNKLIFFFIEKISIFYGRDRNAGFLSLVKIKSRGVWNPLAVETSPTVFFFFG